MLLKWSVLRRVLSVENERKNNLMKIKFLIDDYAETRVAFIDEFYCIYMGNTELNILLKIAVVRFLYYYNYFLVKGKGIAVH